MDVARGHQHGRADERRVPGRAGPGGGGRGPVAPDASADVQRAVDTRRQRRDVILTELSGLPVIPPDAGWSLLIDTTQLGMSPADASERLFTRGRVAATPMTGWGPSGEKYLPRVRQRTRGAVGRPAQPVRRPLGLGTTRVCRVPTAHAAVSARS